MVSIKIENIEGIKYQLHMFPDFTESSDTTKQSEEERKYAFQMVHHSRQLGCIYTEIKNA